MSTIVVSYANKARILTLIAKAEGGISFKKWVSTMFLHKKCPAMMPTKIIRSTVTAKPFMPNIGVNQKPTPTMAPTINNISRNIYLGNPTAAYNAPDSLTAGLSHA